MVGQTVKTDQSTPSHMISTYNIRNVAGAIRLCVDCASCVLCLSVLIELQRTGWPPRPDWQVTHRLAFVHTFKRWCHSPSLRPNSHPSGAAGYGKCRRLHKRPSTAACACLCLCVCYQNISRTSEQIDLKLLEQSRWLYVYNSLRFGVNPVQEGSQSSSLL